MTQAVASAIPGRYGVRARTGREHQLSGDSSLAALFNTLHVEANTRSRNLVQSGKRVVHYTSAAVAFSILHKRQLWMRNAIAMNDYSEIQYGEACLSYAWNSDHGKRLKDLLESTFPGSVVRLEKAHDALQTQVRTNTFLSCVSEHEDSEDFIGRLSMWRAYGGDNGVAIVANHSVLFGEPGNAKLISCPVAYFSREEFAAHLGRVVDNLHTIVPALQAIGVDGVLDAILLAFRYATVSTKHPGFREEQEWRVTYMPTHQHSPLVEKSIEIIGGVPQTVYKIPLGDFSKLDSIIIGPTNLPKTMYDTFVDLLGEIGVNNPQSKVIVSQIPLRR